MAIPMSVKDPNHLKPCVQTADTMKRVREVIMKLVLNKYQQLKAESTFSGVNLPIAGMLCQ